jgi:hypothetical protein
MTGRGGSDSCRGERGIALIMVILVLLVLTVLGITATLMMTQEDRISSRQDLSRSALYVAEAGLRQGELVLQNTPYTNANLTAFLTHSTTTACVGAPDPRPSQPQNASQYDIHHLGTYLTTAPGGSSELANQLFPQTTQKGFAYFSLYVRNNAEDTGGATSNLDARLRLIAVGFITDRPVTESGPTVLAVKILEEEYNWAGQSQTIWAQKDVNAGATNSGLYAGGS